MGRPLLKRIQLDMQNWKRFRRENTKRRHSLGQWIRARLEGVKGAQNPICGWHRERYVGIPSPRSGCSLVLIQFMFYCGPLTLPDLQSSTKVILILNYALHHH